jgi:hypothetical protein
VELDRIAAAYDDDEWVWVKKAYQQVFQVDLDAATPAQIIEAADHLLAGRSKYLRLIVADAAKEFDELSHTGFGQDGTGETDIRADFVEVRGECDRNKFVKDMKEQIAALEQRVARFKEIMANL